ncbi:MAG: hypothetical protein ACHQ9S_17640 [Candidatus Binatia bacterium]
MAPARVKVARTTGPGRLILHLIHQIRPGIVWRKRIIVVLRGTFLGTHRDEIMNLVHNDEDRAKGLNPIVLLA